MIYFSTSIYLPALIAIECHIMFDSEFITPILQIIAISAIDSTIEIQDFCMSHQFFFTNCYNYEQCASQSHAIPLHRHAFSGSPEHPNRHGGRDNCEPTATNGTVFHIKITRNTKQQTKHPAQMERQRRLCTLSLSSNQMPASTRGPLSRVHASTHTHTCTHMCEQHVHTHKSSSFCVPNKTGRRVRKRMEYNYISELMQPSAERSRGI